MELSKLRFQNRYWNNPELLKEDIHPKQLFSAPIVLMYFRPQGIVEEFKVR